MDLIDREALLNSGYPTIYHTEFGDEVINTEDIKNAPTVTIKEWVAEMPLYIKDAMLEALAKDTSKRPHGKWISRGNIGGAINCGRSCSLCGKVVEFSENYCPGCGADMREANDET